MSEAERDVRPEVFRGVPFALGLMGHGLGAVHNLHAHLFCLELAGEGPGLECRRDLEEALDDLFAEPAGKVVAGLDEDNEVELAPFGERVAEVAEVPLGRQGVEVGVLPAALLGVLGRGRSFFYVRP